CARGSSTWSGRFDVW
nr:immunoglobulin heavy chain junction region [Macaca mulatta]MOW95917.1 immunoglobulin heavy chain junction region [Macaca mulatta]